MQELFVSGDFSRLKTAWVRDRKTLARDWYPFIMKHGIAVLMSTDHQHKNNGLRQVNQ